MTITINGTTGIAGVDGSASTPAVQGADTNTGIFFPAADTIAFGEGGVEAMRINSSGNVGIGTSSPSYKLSIQTAAASNNFIQFSAATGDSVAGSLIGRPGNTDLRIQNSENASIIFMTNNTERARIDSSGNVGIGTSSPTIKLEVANNSEAFRITPASGTASTSACFATFRNNDRIFYVGNDSSTGSSFGAANASVMWNSAAAPLIFATSNTERARITSGGDLLVGQTTVDSGTAGASLRSTGQIVATASAIAPLYVNRLTSDGDLVQLAQASTVEGTISVSGTTVSYNGGHLSRWAQMPGTKDDTLVKGTVMSNLDEMNVYIAPTTYWTEEDELPEGVNVGDVKVETHQVDNEQLNKVKVSDVEGDVNVAGVFVNWTYDDAHQVDEINMAMTGDMIIRIAQGVVVQKGDLLMSAGDGTAKPQGDDIVRSKTVAKVTSNHVTCTYADGSYCVPCVLMAC